MSASPFYAHFALNAAVQVPAPQPAPVYWAGLHGSSRAIALFAAARNSPTLTLVVTRSSHQAQVLARDLELLRTGPLPLLLFPDHETLPYDPFSPHPDIVAERLKTLAALGAARHGILLAPASSLMQRG